MSELSSLRKVLSILYNIRDLIEDIDPLLEICEYNKLDGAITGVEERVTAMLKLKEFIPIKKPKPLSLNIFTSSFSKYKGDRGVSIAVSTPEWAKTYRSSIDELKPNWYWVDKWNEVNKLPDSSLKKMLVKIKYKRAYINSLDNLGIEKVLSLLNDGDVLLCWCSALDFCHRQILAEWLRSYEGQSVIVTEI